MKLIIGGSIAIILSIVGFSLYFGAFVKFLAGIVPVGLLLGGGLALYLYREMRCDACDDVEDCCSEDTLETSRTAADTAAEPEEKPVTAPESEKEPEPEPAESVEKADPAGDLPETEKQDPGQPETDVSPADGTPPRKAEENFEAVEPEEKTETRVIGNVDSMVFHTPNCKFSRSKKCTASFETKEAAIEAGYKPCGACKP